jgi:hypothetical protein
LRQIGEIASYEDMRAALMADPQTADWVAEKGVTNGERKLRRLWDRTRPAAGSIADTIADMASQFAEEEKSGAEAEADSPGSTETPQPPPQEPIDIFGSLVRSRC